MLGDKRYCYLLTISDFASRYLLAAEALSNVKEENAFPVFDRVFQEFGLPASIRTDNGVPFASPNSLFGLSKLAVWWLRLGIRIERIKPGHPYQNGRHERIHLTLKKATVVPSASNLLQQQERLIAFQRLAPRRPYSAAPPSAKKAEALRRISLARFSSRFSRSSSFRRCLSSVVRPGRRPWSRSA